MAYDPCYHQPCDNFTNNNDFALAVNSDAIAYAVLQYAMSTEDISAAKGNLKLPLLEVPAE
jgi:aminopeptidase Y